MSISLRNVSFAKPLCKNIKEINTNHILHKDMYVNKKSNNNYPHSSKNTCKIKHDIKNERIRIQSIVNNEFKNKLKNNVNNYDINNYKRFNNTRISLKNLCCNNNNSNNSLNRNKRFSNKRLTNLHNSSRNNHKHIISTSEKIDSLNNNNYKCFSLDRSNKYKDSKDIDFSYDITNLKASKNNLNIGYTNDNLNSNTINNYYTNYYTNYNINNIPSCKNTNEINNLNCIENINKKKETLTINSRLNSFKFNELIKKSNNIIKKIYLQNKIESKKFKNNNNNNHSNIVNSKFLNLNLTNVSYKNNNSYHLNFNNNNNSLFINKTKNSFNTTHYQNFKNSVKLFDKKTSKFNKFKDNIMLNNLSNSKNKSLEKSSNNTIKSKDSKSLKLENITNVNNNNNKITSIKVKNFYVNENKYNNKNYLQYNKSNNCSSKNIKDIKIVSNNKIKSKNYNISKENKTIYNNHCLDYFKMLNYNKEDLINIIKEKDNYISILNKEIAELINNKKEQKDDLLLLENVDKKDTNSINLNSKNLIIENKEKTSNAEFSNKFKRIKERVNSILANTLSLTDTYIKK